MYSIKKNLTKLHHIGPDIFEGSFDLLPHKSCRHDKDVLDAQGVLGRQAGRRCKRIASMGS